MCLTHVSSSTSGLNPPPDLSLKTQHLFSTLLATWDADFYFKVDDDVAVSLPAMVDYLRARQDVQNAYVGCMKSGQVLTDSRLKWYEPESWRFGDGLCPRGLNYPRHASGQIYGLSQSMTRYIAENRRVLHRYANEDVSVGTWMLGLDIQTIHEPLMCCNSLEQCRGQTTPAKRCLAFSDVTCAGICHAEQRLEPLWNACLKDPSQAQMLEKLP